MAVLRNSDPERVDPVRCFPFTDSERWIALCRADGSEVVCIRDPAELEPVSRQLLERELRATEFVPVILRILQVSTYAPPSEWEVDTDRGRTKLVVDHEDDVRQIGTRCVVVVDQNSIRYHVPDLSKLDIASQRILRRFL